MEWESFKDLFHESWWGKIKPFIESEECNKIYKFLKSEGARGKKITPLSENVYKAFLYTPYDEIKVVIMGLSPYHTFYNNLPIADGIAMSCSVTGKLQPSLIQWYNEIDRTYDVKCVREPDLSYLSSQGILMLNSSLTCEKGKPGKHNPEWEPFMKYLFEEVIITTGIPVVFLGKEASKLEKYLQPFTWVFKISHPASAAYSGGDWNSEGMFKSVDKILLDNNGQSINWYKT